MMRNSGSGLNRSKVAGRAFVVLLVLIAAAGGLYSMYGEPNPALQPQAGAAKAEPFKVKSVVLYTGSDCEPCDRARVFFKQRNIRFEERDVEKSPTAMREIEKLGSRIVPVIVLNGEAFYGFLPAQLDAELRGEKTQSR